MNDKTISHSALDRILPCLAERQKTLEHAHLVLTEARAVAERADRTLAMLAAERLADKPSP